MRANPRTRTVRPSAHPCAGGHEKFETYEGFERACKSVRPRTEADLLIGECRRCGSTLSWTLHPTRWDEDDRGPAERSPRGNPSVSRHPDLFEEGETPIFRPLSELTKGEIVALPRRAFNNAEWDSLSDAIKIAVYTNDENLQPGEVDPEIFTVTTPKQDKEITAMWRVKAIPKDVWDELPAETREIIIETDPESEDLIEKVVKPFVEAYKSAIEPDEQYVLDSVGDDGIGQWLSEHSDELVQMARDHGHSEEVDEILESYAETGYSEAQVEQAIDEAMRDADNYDRSVGGEYDRAFFKDSVSTGYISVNTEYIATTSVAKLNDDQLEYAIKEINRQTDSVFESSRTSDDLNVKNLRDNGHTFERDFESYSYVDFEPDWSKISDAVDTILEDVEPESEGEGKPGREKKPERSLEERVVHRFKDGAYVVELLPSEFQAEGSHAEGGLYMCIGDPRQRFLATAKKGKGQAWSLRTQSGKRKVAIFADLAADGNIRRIDQAKGYRNRLPGFEASVAGGAGREGKFKPIEVGQVAEFVASLGVDPYAVNDLGPGMRVALEKADEGSREAMAVLKTLERISPEFAAVVPEYRARRRFNRAEDRAINEDIQGNPSRRRPCPNCGGAAGGFCGGGR